MLGAYMPLPLPIQCVLCSIIIFPIVPQTLLFNSGCLLSSLPKFLELLKDNIEERKIQRLLQQNCPIHKFAVTCSACKLVNLLRIQNTMPQMEEVAVDKVAYIIFPWQVEQVLHIKFPEVSRAQEAGFVSCIMCDWHSVQAQLQEI